MSDFRRTHHDNWQEHKQKFTEDQLLVLTDLLVSPCYYAWRTNKACLQNSLNGIGVVNKLCNCGHTLILCVKDIFTRFCLLWTFNNSCGVVQLFSLLIHRKWCQESLRHVGAITLIVHATLMHVGAQYYSLCTTTAWHSGVPSVTHSRPLYRDGPSNVVPGTEEWRGVTSSRR